MKRAWAEEKKARRRRSAGVWVLLGAALALVAAAPSAIAAAPSAIAAAPPSSAVVLVPALPSDRVVSQADRDVAKAAYGEVRALWDGGDLAAALEPAQDAFDAVPNGSTALLLATLHRSLDHVAAAVEMALLGLDLGPTADEARQLHELLATEAPRHRPPLGWVRLGADPAGATFTVLQGGEVTAVAFTGPRTIGLSLGTHQLRVTSTGHRPQTIAVTVTAPGAIEIDPPGPIYLEPRAEADLSASRPPADVVAFSDDGGPAWAPWLVLGAGVAVIGAGVGLHVWAGSAQDQANGYAGATIGAGLDEATRKARYDAAKADMEGRELGAYVAYGVGAAAVVGGALWLALGDDAEPSTRGSVNLTAAPIAGGAQITLRGGF